MDHPDDAQVRVRAETIYQSLVIQARGSLKRELTAHLRTQRQRREPRANSRAVERRGKLTAPAPARHETLSISEAPAEAAARAVPGNWEGDLILGRDNGSAIGTLVERTTRFVMLIHLPGHQHTAQVFHDATIPTIRTMNEQLHRSLTLYNGKEMAMHKQISSGTGLAIHFADPRAPWQRGSNENTNGLLRQYFPKGISLRQFGPDHLAAVAAQLNGRPRETLGWHTPAEALNDLLGKPFEPSVRHSPRDRPRQDANPPRRPARRVEIFKAVVETLDEVGYGALTIDSVALKARASKATIYRYWSGKPELVSAAIRFYASSQPPLPMNPGSIQDDLAAVVEKIAHPAGGADSIVALTEAIRTDDQLSNLIREYILERRDADVDFMVSRAAKRGEKLDQAVVHQILNLAAGSAIVSILLDGNPPDEVSQNELVDNLMRHLVPRT